MEDEKRERTSNIKLWIGIVIGLVIGYIIGINGYIRVEKDNPPTEANTPVEQKASTNKNGTPSSKQTTKKQSAKQTSKSTDTNAVTLVSYSHDWLDYNAQISVKNNTDKEITSITGRMIYYDMSGNMLDYQDFTKRIDIDACMTKLFELRGYNHKEDYAYYKNRTSSTHPHNKYKVEFQLKSCTYK